MDRVVVPPPPVQVQDRVARLEPRELDLLGAVFPGDRDAMEMAIEEIVVVRREDRCVEASECVEDLGSRHLQRPDSVLEPPRPLALTTQRPRDPHGTGKQVVEAA